MATENETQCVSTNGNAGDAGNGGKDYDPSTDYIHFPTLAPLPDSVLNKQTPSEK